MDYLEVSEVAEHFNLSKSAIQKKCKINNVPKGYGNRYHIDEMTFDEWRTERLIKKNEKEFLKEVLPIDVVKTILKYTKKKEVDCQIHEFNRKRPNNVFNALWNDYIKEFSEVLSHKIWSNQPFEKGGLMQNVEGWDEFLEKYQLAVKHLCDERTVELVTGYDLNEL